MQGFNMGRYVPPDAEGVLSGNQVHGKHALGARARKAASGILTVRFEMPFAVWCGTCTRPTLIAQGVRFNAEKRRAGAYYTTPVWSFTFRHAECGGRIEMRTDPKNTAYVVVSGGRRRDTGDEGEEERTEEQRRGAFASLEKTIEDRRVQERGVARIQELQALAGRDWDDDYARNQRLRRAFRKGRKERAARAAEADALRERLGLAEHVEMLPETEEDARRAALVEFQGAARDDKDAALAKPLFGGTGRAAKGREGLVEAMVTRTRARDDPFLRHGRGERPARAVLGGKRKTAGPCSSGLVAYDSD